MVQREVIVKVALSYPTLCDPMDYKKSMEFSRPVYWSGEPFPSQGDLPNPGIETRSPALQADSLPAEPQGSQKTPLNASCQTRFKKTNKTQQYVVCKKPNKNTNVAEK